MMKNILFIIGIFILAIGLLWVGQGLGYINWPSQSFMISQTKWAYYGGGLAILGLLITIFSRRMP